MTLLDRAASALARRTSRRGFLARTAVVGAAMAADPVNYVLRPASAYATVCGDGASCSSGWTAFCVTINNGVNQCPPGSFIAGWWKADNASVCGGHARYYIDCNASCVGGRHGHYTCSCRCAPGSTCDQRHTCCNQFRYGQCNEQVGCYGPVVCRVVSCVPPWHWAPCSRTAATDNATRSHSAPDLPHTWDAIERRYVALRGHASPLGASMGARHPYAGGEVQLYEHGMLTAERGHPAALLVATAAAYRARGGPRGRFGWPTHDEAPTHDGRAHLVLLQRGLLYAGGGVTAASPDGPWLERWRALCDDAAVAGRPVADVVAAGGDGAGRVGIFQHGLLAWSPATPASVVTGAAAARYVAIGREGSPVGYPVGDTAAVTAGAGGTVTPCEHGGIVVGTTTGPWEVVEPVWSQWNATGGVAGPYGYPVAPPSTDGGQTTQQFQGGTITA